ncbi:putative reverse transcriptase domain-containing protein [Tanacetum coccineum]|uniref:Reverse transcriptase domain-containing protein n=1 Tax=Tanacetum coccineum TaxID=301880 RepID=A0ABQ5JCI6_9ASTR
MTEQRNNGALYYLDRIYVPLKGDVRTLIMDEAHKLKYSVHPGDDKMYYDLRDRYWWPGMKKDAEVYRWVLEDSRDNTWTNEEMFWEGDEEVGYMNHHHFHQGYHPTNVNEDGDLKWWREAAFDSEVFFAMIRSRSFSLIMRRKGCND